MPNAPCPQELLQNATSDATLFIIQDLPPDVAPCPIAVAPRLARVLANAAAVTSASAARLQILVRPFPVAAAGQFAGVVDSQLVGVLANPVG